MTFTREIVFHPAYDKREESQGKYGQHVVDLTFYLKGEKGVIQFRLFTGWGAGIVDKPIDYKWESSVIREHGCGLGHNGLSAPMPADLGYHSPVPQYEEQQPMDCHLLPHGKCYYDGSGLNAYRIFSILVHEGSDGVWNALEEEYKLRLGHEVAA